MPHNQLITRTNGPWVSLLAVVLVTALLWAAKAVLLPLALGVILAFTLTPLVRLFDRIRLPRFLGVALTMLLALSAVGGIGYVIADQFADLSTQLAKYTSSMRKKAADLRLGNDAALRRFTRTVDRVTEQLDNNAADLRIAQPVRVIPSLAGRERCNTLGSTHAGGRRGLRCAQRSAGIQQIEQLIPGGQSKVPGKQLTDVSDFSQGLSRA